MAFHLLNDPPRRSNSEFWSIQFGNSHKHLTETVLLYMLYDLFRTSYNKQQMLLFQHDPLAAFDTNDGIMILQYSTSVT